jgi:YHS domain-containing protein
MIRSFFVDFIVPLIFFLLARSFLRSFFPGRSERTSSARPVPGPPPVAAGGDLKRDPVCGTYVSTASSVSKSVGGQTYYFCSQDCKEQFRG